MDKKDYVITAPRPIEGRMRAIGDTVRLTERQYEAEKGWGGLEPADKAKAKAKVADPK